MTKLTFCGAAGTVTGSCSHVQTDTTNFLVDCGLFQGNRTTQELNFEPFPFSASDADFLLLTHAHIDHSGLLPKLIKAGFAEPIYATTATADLLEFMLRDSAWIQESNAERSNRKRERRGQDPVDPIYTMADAERTLELLQPVEYETWFEPKPGISARLWNAGHLLGSASVEVKITDQPDDPSSGQPLRILFSGDLGPEEKAFHPEPDAPQGYDYIVCESTYGDRDRDDYTLSKRREILCAELTRGLDRRGNIVIPCFAVERSQELLHDIGTLLAEGAIKDCDVYLDSPLARKVTQVFIKHSGSLEDIEIDEANLFRHKRFHLVESVEESKAINHAKRGAIIISASGMCTAGRIKHHLVNNIWREECTILFVGYQAPGTLGHIITSGAKRVRIFGKECIVKADIRRIGNYSAHADQQELISWILERGDTRSGLFLNHGDDNARTVLRDLLAERGLDREKIMLPMLGETFELTPGKAPVTNGAPPQPIPHSQVERDWHNDYAAFILELSSQLQSTTDAEQRQTLIDRVTAALKQ